MKEDINKCDYLYLPICSKPISINRSQTMKFSPLKPNTFCIYGRKVNKQIFIQNDSFVISKYQDRLFPKYYVTDLIDSLIFIAGLNRRAYEFDMRSQKFTNLKSKTITYIHITENEALLFGYKGFYRYNKASKAITKDLDCPTNHFNTRVPNINFDTLFFDQGWAYVIRSNHWLKKSHKVNSSKQQTIEKKNGIEILKTNGNYSYRYDTKTVALPSKPQIINENIWYRKGNLYTKLNPSNNIEISFNLDIPNLDKNRKSYKIYHNYIWIYSDTQVYFIDIKTGLKYRGNIDVERYQGFNMSDCRVFIANNNDIVSKSILLFVSEGIPFDQKRHAAEITDYKKTLKSLLSEIPFSIKTAICVIDSMQTQYANNTNREITTKLTTVSGAVLRNLNFKTIEEYTLCYQNKVISKQQRVNCINRLIYDYGSNKNTKAILNLSTKYYKLLEEANTPNEYYTNAIKNIELYYKTIDSIKTNIHLQDHRLYLEAIANDLLCITPWTCHGGCGGCDHSSTIKPLEMFLKKYPSSQYADDAEWYLINLKYEYDHDSDTKNKIADIEKFIEKYPSYPVTLKAKKELSNSKN